MGKWKKAPQELTDALHEAAKDVEGKEPRKMFGYACNFINGNLWMGCHEENMIIRLSEGDREAIQEELDGAGPFEPMGRRMKEYIALPRKVWEDPGQLAPWVEVSAEYVRSLPRKEKKPRGKKKK